MRDRDALASPYGMLIGVDDERPPGMGLLLAGAVTAGAVLGTGLWTGPAYAGTPGDVVTMQVGSATAGPLVDAPSGRRFVEAFEADRGRERTAFRDRLDRLGQAPPSGPVSPALARAAAPVRDARRTLEEIWEPSGSSIIGLARSVADHAVRLDSGGRGPAGADVSGAELLAWADGYVRHLFDDLDEFMDHVLGKAEAARGPQAAVLGLVTGERAR
jgi:hypothetical protein